jgi:hypothetical protein
MKRGLIDAIGWGAKALFGVAMDKDVRFIREKVQENRQALQAITTYETEHLAILNASFHDIQVNHEEIVEVQQYLWFTETIEKIRHELRQVERVLDDRERRLNDLDDGRLTAALFPPALFERLPKAMDEYFMNEHWYYHAVRVHPLWVANHGGVRLFSVNLPLVRHDTQKGYAIRTFPVPMENQSTTLTVIAPNYASLTPLTGGVTEPQFCIGQDPLVCDEGPQASPCTKALVTDGTWDECRAKVEHESEKYYTLTGNSIVLIGPGTTVTERCPQTVTSTEAKILPGTNVVTWSAGCRLQTEGFSMRATRRNGKTLTWNTPGQEVNLAIHPLEHSKNTGFVTLNGLLRPPPLLDIPEIPQVANYVNLIWLPVLTLAVAVLIILQVWALRAHCLKTPEVMTPVPKPRQAAKTLDKLEDPLSLETTDNPIPLLVERFDS